MKTDYEKGYAIALEYAAPFLEKIQECADKRLELADRNGYLKGLIVNIFDSLDEHGIDPADVFSDELISAISEALKQR